MATDYAASVQGVALRVTRLNADGTFADTSISTSKFIRLSFTPEYEDGEEIIEKAADGTICVTFRSPDTLKRVNLEVAICDPDPDITGLLGGGLVLAGGVGEGNLGWASPQVGEDPAGNGVAIEVWSRAIIDGKPAASNAYFQWIFPYAVTRQSGDRVIENGLLANTFEGWGVGNAAFADGPDGAWPWSAAAARPYAYGRVESAPTGDTRFNYFAEPSDTFAAMTEITASDATNAAKLAGLGFYAVPQTAWTVGQKITIGTFDFSWTGTAWDFGAA